MRCTIGDLNNTLVTLRELHDEVPPEHKEIREPLEFAYAFVNATKQHEARRIDLGDPAQNEFVQNYLSALMDEFEVPTEGEPRIEDVDGYSALELSVELIQEKYTGRQS